MWIKRGLFIIALFAIPMIVHAQPRVIEVSGQGSVSAVPDEFRFDIAVEAEGDVIAKLNKSVEHSSQQILSFLLEEGIDKSDLQSTHVRLNPVYRSTSNGREQDGFRLSRAISVTLEDIKRYDTILDGVMRLGATRLSNFRHGFKDGEALYLLSLERAITNARARAAQMAKTLGVEVGLVMMVVEQSQYQPRPFPVQYNAMAAEARMDSASMPGEEEVNATVRVTFALQDN